MARLVVALCTLGTVASTPVAAEAQSGSAAPLAVVTPPDLMELLRPCLPGPAREAASLVEVSPGVGIWETRCERRPLDAQYVSGTVTERAGQYRMRTAAGVELPLVSAFPHQTYFDMAHDWMRGFMEAGDGPIVLQGAFRVGGIFAVHGFALRLRPEYESFTFGRILLPEAGPARAYIASPHFGAVEVESDELRVLLRAMPRLGVILPGEPARIGDGWVYQGRPGRFFGLARPTGPARAGPDQTIVVTGDMALSVFQRKPIVLPERFLDRVQHRARFWVEGTPVAGPDGAIERWAGTYASPPTDQGPPMPTAGASP